MSFLWKLAKDGSHSIRVPECELLVNFEDSIALSSPPKSDASPGWSIENVDDGSPEFEQCYLPSDNVLVAVDPRICNPIELVTQIIERFRLAEHAGKIQVLFGEGQAQAADSIRQTSDFQVECLLHDSSDQDHLAYLAADENAEPIYVNRDLFDADFVLPLVLDDGGRQFCSTGQFGLLPNFVDHGTRNRWLALGKHEDESTCTLRNEVADQLGSLLGCLFRIAVRQGQYGEIRSARFGMVTQNCMVTQQLLADKSDSESRATSVDDDAPHCELVVAGIDSPPESQNWEAICRAVWAAKSLAGPQSTIAIVSQVSQKAKGLLTLLGDREDDETVLQRIRSRSGAEKAQAKFLAETQREHQLFLLSKLKRDAVEQLGIGYLESEQELTQLIRGFNSVCYLTSAQQGIAPTVVV